MGGKTWERVWRGETLAKGSGEAPCDQKRGKSWVRGGVGTFGNSPKEEGDDKTRPSHMWDKRKSELKKK